MNKPFCPSRIPLYFLLDWHRLLKARLTKRSRVAPEDVQDEDSRAYRQDQRLDFAYVTLTGGEITHVAQLVLESDDRRYHCRVVLMDNDDKVVFERDLTDPPQDGEVRRMTATIDGKRCNFVIGTSKVVA